LPLAGAITKSELMALASVSPTVAGSKPKKLLDQTRDVLRLKPGPAKDFETCETVSIARMRSVHPAARSAQLGLKAHQPFRGLHATGLRC
jgi:hypothetical protein